MISVIIPTYNAGATLGATLASLLAANAEGLIREVIVTDGGSTDSTLAIAQHAGARIVQGGKGRGRQLAEGAAVARGEVLMFLHADTVLADGWAPAALARIDETYGRSALVFRLRFDRQGFRPRAIAMGANLRARVLRLPYGDQGLVITRRLYDKIGGYGLMPLFEDVDIIRRLVKTGGRAAVQMLPVAAVTSAVRYADGGYFARVWRNFRSLRMYFAGVPPTDIVKFYEAKKSDGSGLGHDGKTALGGAGQDKTGP